VNILVVDLHGKFGVKVQSESPVSGWVLKEETTNRTISKGGLDATNQFKFQVSQPFRDSYHLTLYLNSNREQIPVMIRLKAAKEDTQTGKNTVDGLEDFQDNPDRPFNAMVKNFYERAVDHYSKGNNVQALALLQQAAELDSLQPQVQALLLKIQGPTEKSASPLDKVREAYKKGKKEEALAKLEDYLDDHPDDEEAQELKDKIEGKHHSPKALPNSSKTKKASTRNTPVAESDETRQAKADQAYNLGLESYRNEDYAAAKKFWEETLQIEPTHLQAKRNLERLKQEHPDSQ
jgi:tetratricopeptide (TPR) repeat protein